MSDSESVSSECKPKPCFSNLPWFLKQRIVDCTDLFTRYRLRKVSKDLIYYVDRSPFHVKNILFGILQDLVVFWVTTETSLEIQYHNVRVSKKKRKNRVEKRTETESLIDIDLFVPDYVQRGVKDLAILFRNSKLTVDELSIGYRMSKKEYFTSDQHLLDQALSRATFKEEFDKLPHQLNVGTLEIIALNKDDRVHIEPYLKPDVLKNLDHIVCDSDNQILEHVRLTRKSPTDEWEPLEPEVDAEEK